MRAFVSVNLSEDLQKQLTRLQKKLRPQLPMVRWISPKNSHLTLKFLGDVRDEDLPRLDEALRPIADDTAPFTLQFQGLGQFPPKGSLNVLWIGAKEGDKELALLERRLREALLKYKISFDKKRFTPHITLGRAPQKKNPIFWRPSKDIQSERYGEMEVDAFSLMQSRLHAKGSIYTEVIHYELNQGQGKWHP